MSLMPALRFAVPPRRIYFQMRLVVTSCQRPPSAAHRSAGGFETASGRLAAGWIVGNAGFSLMPGRFPGKTRHARGTLWPPMLYWCWEPPISPLKPAEFPLNSCSVFVPSTATLGDGVNGPTSPEDRVSVLNILGAKCPCQQ